MNKEVLLENIEQEPDMHVPVLIVGGGIVGLSAALFLQQQGIDFLLVERHEGTSIHPRSRGVNMRSMELYRQLGLEKEIQEAGKEIAPSNGIYKAATLIEAIEPLPRNQPPALPAQLLDMLKAIGPAFSTRCTQDKLEPVLRTAATAWGGDLRFYTALTTLTPESDGVTVRIKDRRTAKETTVRADYLIAADGARSPIRQALSMPVSGAGTLGHFLNIYFRADLRALVQGREFSICLIDRPELHGLFTSINNSDLWVFHLVYEPAAGQRPEDFTDAWCIELLRQAAGMPGLDISIISIMPWEAAVSVADHFRQNRIFLAGDAAHLMPPWGGQGANSGVQDVHNLAWKLAAVLRSQAMDKLLDTYQAERHPVDNEAAERAGAMAGQYGMLDMDKFITSAGKSFESGFITLMGLNYSYHSAAIIPEKDMALSPALKPDGRPGMRVPNLWLQYKGETVSTVDLCARNFTLLCGPESAVWEKLAMDLSLDLGITIQFYGIGYTEGMSCVDMNWQEALGLQNSGALLVRPDGFVAWRQPLYTNEAADMLERALLQIMGRI